MYHVFEWIRLPSSLSLLPPRMYIHFRNWVELESVKLFPFCLYKIHMERNPFVEEEHNRQKSFFTQPFSVFVSDKSNLRKRKEAYYKFIQFESSFEFLFVLDKYFFEMCMWLKWNDEEKSKFCANKNENLFFFSSFLASQSQVNLLMHWTSGL